MTNFCITKINNLYCRNLANIPYYVEGEFIWSYIGRLAFANGFNNTLDFLRFIFHDDNLGFKYITDILEFLDLRSSFVMRSSCTLDTVSFLLSDSVLSNLISSYMYGAKLKSNSKDWLSRKRNMKICPVCYQEQIHTGIFHYLTVHQLPGVNICPYHNVPLKIVEAPLGLEISQPSFKDNEGRIPDYKASMFMNDLYLSNFSSNRTKTTAAIIDCLKNRYGCNSKYEIISNLLNDKELMDFNSNRKLLVDSISDSSKAYLDLDYTVRFLATLYNSATEFICNSTMHNTLEAKIFESMCVNHFTLNSEFCSGRITVNCKCGKSFVTTSDSLLHGEHCPYCFSRLDIQNQAQFVEARDKVILDLVENKPGRIIDSIDNGMLRIIDIASSTVYKVNALTYLEKYSLPVQKNLQNNIEQGNDDYFRIEQLYLRPAGKIQGVPICDSLLFYLGLVKSIGSNTIALFRNTYINDRLLFNREGITVNVFTLKGNVSEEDWLLKSFLATLHFYSYTTSWTVETSLGLACKMKHLGISIKSLSKNDIPLFESDCNEAERLLRRV